MRHARIRRTPGRSSTLNSAERSGRANASNRSPANGGLPSVYRFGISDVGALLTEYSHGMKFALTPSAVRLRASAASLSSLLPELRYHPRAIVGLEHVGPAPAS
jgi:hypothetical protein